jgi:hypothetical protein
MASADAREEQHSSNSNNYIYPSDSDQAARPLLPPDPIRDSLGLPLLPRRSHTSTLARCEFRRAIGVIHLLASVSYRLSSEA